MHKLDIILDISDKIMNYKVIKLILQPLVENAILHGIEKLKSGGIITICGCKVDEFICFEVNDNGIGMDEDTLNDLKSRIVSVNSSASDRSGIGLSNVYKRLKLYFGDKSSFEISSKAGEGTSVKISMPATI